MPDVKAYVDDRQSSEFYPTPEKLVQRMLGKIKWDPVEAILEPSAGKGDILRGLATADKHVKPKSNADRIRQMTDEELSAFLGGIADNCSYNTCDNCHMYGACFDVPISRDKWLRKEVSEDAAD